MLLVPLIRVGRWAWRVAPKVGWTLLVLFVLAAIPWTYFNIKYGRELEAELARIKAAGEPLTLVEAAPKPVPDDQNAAVLYNEVFRIDWERFQPQHKLEPAAPPEEPRPEQAPKLVREGFRDLPAEYLQAVEAYCRGERDGVERTVREALSDPRVRERLAILREASRLPAAVFPVNWEAGAAALFPHLARYREATRWVTARMLVTAADGDVDGALEWCRVGLRMSEHAAAEPTLIAELVGIALQAITLRGAEQMLAQEAASVAAADRMSEYVGTIDMKESFLNAMRGERAFGRCVFEEAESMPAAEFGGLLGGAPDAWPLLYLYAGPLGKPVRAFDELTYLKCWRVLLETSAVDYREAKSGRLSDIDNAYGIPATAPVARMLVPVFARAGAKRDAAIGRLDEFRTVLALKVYKQEHGAYPESLDELRRTLSWELPKDIFSGEAFRYQRKGEGFMLYSFGRDLDDDGGVREEDRKYQDGDIVWECSR